MVPALPSMLCMLIQLFLLISSIALAAPLTSMDSMQPNILDKRSSSYWMENIQRQGVIPFGNDTSYKVFRNVKDYGAVGDGNADDTAAINKAITDGNRCGEGCDSSTTTPAIVYFPAGTYKISQSIILYYYTVLIGDATNLPRLQGTSDFTGLALLDADPYIPGGNGAQWYTNQNQFFRQIRNLIVDMTQMPEAGADGGNVNGLHWQVAQASSLQNVVFDMKPNSATNRQRGIMMENGSGMFMSDVIFNGGNTGAFLGSQQLTTRNFTFNNCGTGVALIWDWLWTFKQLTINNCDVGLNITTTGSVNETLGSAILMDSKIQANTAGVVTSYTSTSQPEAGSTFLIHNVDFTGTHVAVMENTGASILPGGGVITQWGQGNAYMPPAGSQRVKRMPQSIGSGDIVSASSCTDNIISTTTVSVSPLPAAATSTPRGLGPYSTSTGSYTGLTGSPTGKTSCLAGSSPPSGFPFACGPSSSSFVTSTLAPSSGISLSSSSITRMSSYSNSSVTGKTSTVASIVSAGGVCTASTPLSTPTHLIQQTMNAPIMDKGLLDSSGNIFSRSKPQYIDMPASSFISIKTFGAKGDGVADDTAALQKAMDSITTSQILYFDHGAYVITDTVNVSSNIRMTGEIWPMIMVSGPNFQDQSNPRVGFNIGNPGDKGSVEITDLIFETKGPAPGAIMMQWNVEEASQGSCGMWDTHFRVGGSAGTELEQDKCMAKIAGSQQFNPECAGSFMMFHMTQTGSGYLENTWFWVADHELDMSLHNQTNIYNGRGVFIESQGPTWLWGTSSEHSQLYNYQLANAKNIFMGAIQTETAYMQSSPDALQGGFTPNAAYSDPTFEDCTTEACKKTWGLRVVDSQDVYMFGGGLYSFFDNYTQTCLDTESCQTNMVDLECSNSVYLFGLVTKAATNQVVVNGRPAVLQKDNPNTFGATVLLYEQL